MKLYQFDVTCTHLSASLGKGTFMDTATRGFRISYGKENDVGKEDGKTLK